MSPTRIFQFFFFKKKNSMEISRAITNFMMTPEVQYKKPNEINGRKKQNEQQRPSSIERERES